MQVPVFFFVALAAVHLQVSSAGTIDVATLGGDGETERIIDGKTAEEGQFPFAAVLFYNDQFVCTSSIISPRTMITAAHCVVFNEEEQPASAFHAIANNRRSSNDVRIDFVSVTPHPNYTTSNGIQNDIAVLTTAQDITFSDTVDKVCIAGSDTPRLRYKNATAMGWGFTQRNRTAESIPDELQYVEQKIIPNSICRIAYFGLPVESNKICAGFLNGICNGDSGGPLVHLSADERPVEIGVASYINALLGCGSFAPGVFTRISSYIDFIMMNAEDASSICVI